MVADTRSRMIEAAIDLLHRRGLAAMSFTDVIAESGAARGAIYHHFPGGKKQLAVEAVQSHADSIRGYLQQLPGATPSQVVENFVAGVRSVVEASAAGGGCVIAAVTVDDRAIVEDQLELRQVAAGAFGGWTDELTKKLATAGMAADDAADLAQLMIITLQGAHVLCRAAGNIRPFESATRALLAAIPAT